MDEGYRYTQIGFVTILLILLAAVFTACMIIYGLDSFTGLAFTVTVIIIAGLFILALAAFYSFTIQIASGKVNFWFGIGVGKKSFAIKDIQSVEIVKTPWYYFWGIKSIPGGWLYSIAPGGKAIELVLRDNKKIRLGTDRPEEIIERINRDLLISG